MRLTEQHHQLAPKPGYVYLFDSTIPHQRYYFVSELGYGVQSHAQLVLDRETGLKVVQKVDRKLRPSTLEHEEPADITILRRLISSHRLADYRPRWITLLNYDQVPAYQETERAGTHLNYQVSYWKFCNGRTLYNMVDPYILEQTLWLAGNQNGTAPGVPLPKIPISLVARAIRNICETLEVMYQGGTEAVYHCDLHASNIFLHWTKEDPLPEFYIGDFGMARTASQSLLDSKKFCPKNGIPFDKQPQGTKPPDVAPEGFQRRWDFVINHECSLARFFGVMSRVAATKTAEENVMCIGIVRLPIPRPQAPQRRGLVKQIAQQKNQPTRQAHISTRDKEANANNANSPGIFNAGTIEAAGHLEKEALQWEQHTHNFQEFVRERKKKALLQEFETSPFVFRRDGPEAKKILRTALRLPERNPYRVYHGRRVNATESLEEIWGRENVAGSWRVVEVRV
ncbi:hypothetical protein SMACR_03188 [Sordaria macrospora]|uniref:WGS project CABT00000000 data, contig 2.7 n=2 Tax=Sordaria macrospora TaxID=5147 RepID=F7VTZ5_SORMK|nr:uncharacterized protein SMAC_03188 [Sordaria macrospora k-hell]KAA8635959.1 hypothetical protein SMACR_03188 [Sordaria macrospora]WPJ60763.1 hypothetical protein SMAC4_03188 [Sordaria macrospora]CCC08983.1 unnamed protein product [Sordaria macrospora k-hell]